MIELKLKYQHKQFILDVETTLSESLIYGIFGHSGAGKTTCLDCFAGYKHAEEIYLRDSETLADLIHDESNIGYVDQAFTLMPHMTVQRQFDFFSQVDESSKSDLIKDLEIEPYLQTKPGMLSGGQQQRVAISLALVRKPDVLLLDEPFAHLDVDLKHMYIERLKHYIQHHNILTFIVSHDLSDLENLTTAIIHLKNGRLNDGKS